MEKPNQEQEEDILRVEDLKLAEKTTVNYFESLPLTLLSEVFSYFKGRPETNVLNLVCKQWFQAMESVHGFNLPEKSTLIYDKIGAAENFENTWRKFVNLEVRKLGGACLKRIKRIVSRLELTQLTLIAFNQNDIRSILELDQNTLKTLVLRDVAFCDADRDPTLDNINFKHLKSLELSMQFAATIPPNLIRNFSNLERLKIKIRNGDVSILREAISISKNTLQYLYIVFDNFENIQYSDFKFLKEPKVLKTLCIESLAIGDVVVDGIVINLPPSLQVVKLQFVKIHDDHVLQSLHETLPNLTTLELLGRRDMSTIFKYPISQFLKAFTVTSSMELSNIPPNHNLTYLMIHSRTISIENLSILVQKFPFVEWLVTLIPRGHDFYEGLSVISRWTKLKRLEFITFIDGRCRNIGDPSTHINENISFPRLTKLSLSKVKNLSYLFDKVQLPRVRNISLCDCEWGKDQHLSTPVFDQLEKITWICYRSGLPTSNLARFFEDLKNYEKTLEFVKNNNCKSFYGSLILDDIGHGGDVDGLINKWRSLLAKELVGCFKLPLINNIIFSLIYKQFPTRFLMNNLNINENQFWIECDAVFRTDLIHLQVQIRNFSKYEHSSYFHLINQSSPVVTMVF